MPRKKLTPEVVPKKPLARTKKTTKQSSVSVKKSSTRSEGIKRIVIKRGPKQPQKPVETVSHLSALLAQKRVPSKKKEPVSEPVVALPINMSLRAHAKVSAILQLADKDFYDSVQKISYVAAFCFIVLGSVMALGIPDVARHQQTAQLVTTELPSATLTPIAKPEFVLIDTIPNEITTLTQFSFTATEAKEVEVRLRSLSDGKVLKLRAEKIQDTLYRFIVDPSALLPAKYSVRVSVIGLNNIGTFMYEAGDFYVTAKATDVDSGDASMDSAALTETDDSVSSETQEGDTNQGEESVDDLSEIDKIRAQTDEFPLQILPLNDVLSKAQMITILAPSDAKMVELYVRPMHSINKRFIGLARQSEADWQFFFDTINTPDGEYELLATTRSGDKFIESRPTIIAIKNRPRTQSSALEETLPDEEDASADEQSIADRQDIPLRSFSDLSLSSAPSSTKDGGKAALQADDILEENSDKISELLKRYAVARQTNDETMIALALGELESSKKEIVDAILTDPNTSYLADDVDKRISSQFEVLQKRIDTFEELRSTASDRKTAEDSDKDGISDFDETYLYDTDPNIPDTDADGFTDGIEILRGFNPLDEAAEAVLDYESPKESVALVQEEILEVESVSAFFAATSTTGPVPVQAEIRGKGLPNSFVTLFIFSTPAIVTVKTDSDGSFVYTFEKELEDGEHEAYVAITDNTGLIVAQSNPFKFIKEAEAFTPMNGSVSEVSTEQVFDEPVSLQPYAAISGIGIIALGLILLMLGVSMREKRSAKDQLTTA